VFFRFYLSSIFLLPRTVLWITAVPTHALVVSTIAPPRGGAEKKPPSSRGAAPPLSSRLRRSRTRPPRGASPPRYAAPPLFVNQGKEGSFTTFIQQDDKRDVILLCYQGISPYHVSLTGLRFYIRYLPPSYHALRQHHRLLLITL
jgi:hypothetical protein